MNSILIGIALGAVIVSILLTIFLIYRHMKHWIDPMGQTYIIRILLMVPVYAMASWLSLLFVQHTIYFNLVRDCYEAFALYQFLSLLIHYFDTEMRNTMDEDNDATTDVYLQYFNRHYHPYPCCCLPMIQPGASFLLTTKRCVLQYVFIKPVLSMIAIVLELFGLFHEGSVMPNHGYMWITLITNISMTISLYYLIIFYDTIEESITQHRPLYKLLTIKLLLFFIFWQSLAIDTLFYFELMPRIEILKNLLVCLEMLVISLTNLWIFPYKEYRDGTNHLNQALQNFATTVMNPKDIVKDILAMKDN